MKQLFIILIILVFHQNISSQIFERFDINPDGDSDPVYLTEYNNRLIFQADDGIHGDELWVSDGSQQGTMMLKDLREEGGGNPIAFTEYNGLLYFTAYSDNHGLWVTDGSTDGTRLLKDAGGYRYSIDEEMFVFKNRLYFVIKDFDADMQYLYLTDGTEEGTSMVSKISDVLIYDYHFSIFQDHIYFCGHDSIHGIELWVSDGTTSGTHHLKDINPEGDSYPDHFTESNDELFFTAKDTEALGRELWATDGSIVNTRRIRNVEPHAYCTPIYLVNYHDRLYFSGNDSIHGRELWVSDGTHEGTYMFENLNYYFTLYPSSDPRHFFIFQDKLFFSAVGKTEGGGMVGEELFVSDGTTEGTLLFKDLDDDYESSRPSAYQEYNNKLYFKAGGHQYYGLWMSYGTSEATFPLRPDDAELWNPLEMAYYLVEANGSLFFKARYDSTGLELWSYTDATGLTNEEIEETFIIYPNPSQDHIKFELDESINFVDIYDISGKLILRHFESNSVNVSHLKKGSYFVKLNTDKGSKTSKFIKVE